jgi:molybdopterin-guanine dinucleotide biosynthesis protein A
MHHPDVTGFVLAGGKSTRMGRDKAALLLEGRTLLEHALRTVRQACGSALVLGSRELYGHYGAEVVEDIFPGCGPLSGIHAALTHTRTEFNLIIAVDTPFLSAFFLRFMVERAVVSGATVTTPEIAGYRQPLCSVYKRDFLSIAEEALRGKQELAADERGSTRIKPTPLKHRGTEAAEEDQNSEPQRTRRDTKSRDYKIVPLFPEGRTLVITEEEMRRFAFTPEMFENLNTPGDLERARRRQTP